MAHTVSYLVSQSVNCAYFRSGRGGRLRQLHFRLYDKGCILWGFKFGNRDHLRLWLKVTLGCWFLLVWWGYVGLFRACLIWYLVFLVLCLLFLEHTLWWLILSRKVVIWSLRVTFAISYGTVFDHECKAALAIFFSSGPVLFLKLSHLLCYTCHNSVQIGREFIIRDTNR